MRSFLAPLVLVPALMAAACSTLPESSKDMTEVQVTALYRERIMLPPGGDADLEALMRKKG